MGESWNRKRAVEDSPTQWSVLLAIVLLLLAPCAGLAAMGYFYVNGATTGLLLTIGGLCLLAVALPLLALVSLTRRSRADRQRRRQNQG